MKKSFTILASALALFVLVSCEKEISSPEKTVNAATTTFTLSLDATKIAVDTDGKTTWEVGDVIAVSDDYSFENITLTAADIDGSIARVATTIPPGASSYYACYPASRFGGIKDGKVCLKEAGKQDGDGAACVSICHDDLYNFQFKNVFALLSFSATADATAVAVEGNNGETVDYESYEIDPSTGVISATSGPKTRVKAAFKSGSTCLVAVPEANLTSGFTVKFYKAAEMVAQATTSNALSTSRNKLVKMGDISSKVETITSYYEWWQAGKDIELGEITYNKATLGEGTLLADGANITTNGIYFVPAGATVNTGKSATYGSLRVGATLIIGNIPGTRPNLNIPTSEQIVVNPKATGTQILGIKNMTLDNHSSNNYPVAMANDGQYQNIILDNCLFCPKYGLSYVNSAARSYANVVLYNTDYKVPAQSNYILNSGTNTVTYPKLTVKNCRFYPDESKIGSFWDKFMFFTGSAATLDTFVIENSLFYDVLGNTAAYSGAMSYVAAINKISFKNNIVYTSTERTTIGSLARATTTNPTSGEAYGNIIYNSPAKDFLILFGGKTKWPAGCGWEEFKKVTDDPLSAHNIATGTFTVAAGFESYGPER